MKSFVCLLAFMFACCRFPCAADCCCHEVSCDSGNYYVSAFGGVNSMDFSNSHPISLKTGYAGAFAFGYNFDPYRLEGEVSYRWNKISARHSYGSNYLNGHADSWSWMANAYYDLHFNPYFTPYIGLGMGYTNIKAHGSDHDVNIHGRSSGIAYQAIVGAKTRIFRNTDLGLEYRFFAVRANVTEQSVGATWGYAF